MLLQILWLAGILLTGAASNPRKLVHLAIYTVVVGMLVSLLPAGLVFKLRRFKEYLVQNEKALIITLCLTLLLVGVVYAHFQRLWPYDEESNYEAARMVAEQGPGELFANYSQIPWLGRWHPPLTPLMYGFAMRLFGVSLIVPRLVALALVFGTTLVTYYLGRELYDGETGVLAAFLFLSFPLVLRQGTVAMTDVPVMFFFSLGLLAILRMVHTPTTRLAVAAGLIIGAGLITKYTMLFIYPVILSFFVTQPSFRRLKFRWGIVGVVSAGILGAWLAYAYRIGALAAFESSLITEFEPGYFVTEPGGNKWLLNSLLTKLSSALGAYSLPLLLLGGLIIVWQRKRSDLLVLLWVGVVSVLLILSIPDHRYFMLIFPALAIMMAHGLGHIPEAAEQAILLALLYCGGALYLFVDWFRAAQLFVQ
jgi:4-amino-4-deoxy-L-arabinose transferase-like glycosyltransferase